ncbi:cytochrome P450 4C1-like isoform X3 [Lycorma delicatula]|uniref:cytochrome P450 4C1-like isoform X3 n=1 Tax=Lycorma delicatula TaxID=130591 RepID=UPI003F50FB88
MDQNMPTEWMLRIDLDIICYKIFWAIMILLITSLAWHSWRIIRIERIIKNKIPGPPIWPIIGNAHLFFGLDAHKIIQKSQHLIEEYGGSFRLWIGPFLWINLAEPRHLEAILTSEYTTNKDPSYKYFKQAADGLFTASGENWKQLRKMVNPTFNKKILESFTNCFNEESKILVNVLEEKIDAPPFDIHEYVARTALDILCGTQMNVKTSEQIDNTSDFAKYLLWAIHIIKERFFKIYLQPDILYYMTKRSEECKKYIQHLHKFMKEIIQKRKLIRKEDCVTSDSVTAEEKKRVFLDAILDHYKDLSDDQLVFKVGDMFVGGTDTTAIAISYALMILGIYKDKQEMVYKEIVDAIGESNEDITYIDLPKLRYLEMILKEVLRHYTVPIVVRRVEADTYIDGYAFAMMSMKIVVATVIKNYKIHSDVDLKKLQFNNTFMMDSKNGYPVQISRR